MFNITCFNLERCKERRNHIDSILTFANCRYNFFNSVDGNMVLTGQKHISEYSEELDISEYFSRQLNMDKKFYGAIGLKLSSYILLRKLEKSGDSKPLLILEDDTDLDAEFVYKVENTLTKMKDPWDIIILSSSYRIDSSRGLNEETGLVGISFFTGTYAYLVNGSKTAKKLADFLEECPPHRPIDVLFRYKTQINEIISYAYANHLATHLGDVFTSTIATSSFVGPAEMKKSLYQTVKSISN